MNTKLHYKYIGYVEDWEIDDRCKYGVKVSGNYNMEEEKLAKASYSYSPGNNIMFVNSNNNDSDAIEKGSAVMHELLHIVGLRHTSSLEGKEIPNTDDFIETKHAGRSLMCSVYTAPQRHLNFLDKRAIETLYPK